jgi:histone H3/H4
MARTATTARRVVVQPQARKDIVKRLTEKELAKLTKPQRDAKLKFDAERAAAGLPYTRELAPGVAPRRRWKAGTKALREIRRMQKNCDTIIPKAPFRRLVKEMSNAITTDHDFRWTQGALGAMQEAAEMGLVEMFQNAQLCALHAKRITVQTVDIQLSRRLGGVSLLLSGHSTKDHRAI